MAMFSEPIEMWDAVITGIDHRIKNGLVSSRIKVVATFDQQLAKELDVNNLVFAENGTPKQGFSKVELSCECASFRAVFEPDPQLKQSLELTGDSTDGYEVEHTGANGMLRLKLRLNYHGDPHMPLAYVMSVGGGQAALRITPLQKEIETQDETELTIQVPGQEPVKATMGALKRAAAAVGKGNYIHEYRG